MSSVWLARRALALYPLAYRRRYGAEMEALVEDSGASPAVLADLARGAARAHLRPEPAVAGEVGPGERVRLGVSSVLLGWVCFVIAGLAFYKTTEGAGFEGAAGSPGFLGVAQHGIQILATLASLAVAIGAAPLVLAALRQAGPRTEARRATRLACACVATFVGAGAALVVVAQAKLGLSGGAEALILAAWTVLAVACGIGCALAARRGLLAIAVPRRVLLLALACATVVAVAMVGIAALTLAYGLDLVLAAPRLAGAANGPLGMPNVRVSLVLQLLVMVAAAAPAALGASRAWRAAAAG